MTFFKKLVMACAVAGVLAGGTMAAQAAPAAMGASGITAAATSVGPQIEKAHWHHRWHHRHWHHRWHHRHWHHRHWHH
ncbi:MAG TPA: hypothetical protein VGG12_09435, partial [Methylovirgula sp.]